MPPIRIASGLILRRAVDDDRVFLARRCARMRFFGDVHAFPGGTVDAVDRQLGARDAPDDADLVVLRSTLIREMIEELSLDLRAGAPDRGAVDEDSRRALLAEPARWLGQADATTLASAGVPALRLITPDFYPRRYDTFMFLHLLGGRAEPRLLPEELEDGRWDTAAGWLAQWERGEILLAPPTVLTLRALDGVAWEDAPSAFAALQADVEGPVPQAIHVQPAVRLLALRTPTLPPARHTNCYFVGRDPAYIVDPATPHPDQRDLLSLALDRAGDEGYRFRAILLTHHHGDHVGAVQWLRQKTGLPVWAHEKTADALLGAIDVDRRLDDEERMPLGRYGDLVALHTPGHAAGHLCYWIERYRGLVAGDMISTLSSILVHPDDGDMTAYMRSLHRLRSLDPRVVYPAHGPADTRGSVVVEEQIAHRDRRRTDVLDAVRHGRSSVDAITETVYGDVPRPMLAYAAASVRSILAQLEGEALVRQREDGIEAVQSKG